MTSNINNYNSEDLLFLVDSIGLLNRFLVLHDIGIDNEAEYILASRLIDSWYKGQSLEIYEIGAKMILDCYPDAVATLKAIPSNELRVEMTVRFMFKSLFHFHFLPDYELGFANFDDAEANFNDLGKNDLLFFQEIAKYFYKVSNEQVILDIVDAKRNLYGDILTEGCINVKDVYKYILDNRNNPNISNINNYISENIIFLVEVIGNVYRLFTLHDIGIDDEAEYILASILLDSWHKEYSLEAFTLGAEMILDRYPDCVEFLKDMPSDELIVEMTVRFMFKSLFHFYFLFDYFLGFANINDAEAFFNDLGINDMSFIQEIVEYVFLTSNEQVILDIADAKRNLYGDILTEGCINVKDIFKNIFNNRNNPNISNIKNYNPEDILFLVDSIGLLNRFLVLHDIGIDNEAEYILASRLIDSWYKEQSPEIYEIGAKMILDCYPDAVATLKAIPSDELRVEMTVRFMFKSLFHFHFLSDYELGFANINDAEANFNDLGKNDLLFFQEIAKYFYKVSNEQVILDIADAKRNLYGDILTEGCINVKDVYKYILDNKK